MLFRWAFCGLSLRSVDDHTPAEELPSLYRAVLDTVTALEHLGDRVFALWVRREALRTYSTRWDERGRGELRQLDRMARDRLAGVPDPGTRPSLTTRTGPA